MTVNFAEDPYRQHGLQVRSYATGGFQANETWTIDTVPIGKKYILTDVRTQLHDGNFISFLSNDTFKDHLLIKSSTGSNINLGSGIVFEKGTTIQMKHNQDGAAEAISGYFVDL